MYFCKLLLAHHVCVLIEVYAGFITFTTIGYGDFSPVTALGRSIFIFWAFMGIGAMTVLIAGISYLLVATSES